MVNNIINLGVYRQERSLQLSKETLLTEFEEHFPLLNDGVELGRITRLIDYSPEAVKNLFITAEETKVRMGDGVDFNRYVCQINLFNRVFNQVVLGILTGLQAMLKDHRCDSLAGTVIVITAKINTLAWLLGDIESEFTGPPQYVLSCRNGENIRVIEQVYLEERTLAIVGIIVNDCSLDDDNPEQYTLNIDPVKLTLTSYDNGLFFWFCNFTEEISKFAGQHIGVDSVLVHGSLEYDPATDEVTTRASSEISSIISIESLIVEVVSL